MRPSCSTKLQVAQRALAAALLDARDQLTEAEYLVLLAFATDVVAREVARCTRWDDAGDGETA